MKLSEAIRLGSLLIQEPKAADTTRCAIGMALSANGVELRAERLGGINYSNFARLYPWLSNANTYCPVCENFLAASHIVWHIFDWHVIRDRSLTIEQLADFIGTIEPKELEPEQYQGNLIASLGQKEVLKGHEA